MTFFNESLPPICFVLVFLLQSATSTPTRPNNDEISRQKRFTPDEFTGALELGHRQNGDKLIFEKKVEIVDDGQQGQVFQIPNGYELTQLRVILPEYSGVHMSSPFMPAKVQVRVKIVPDKLFKGSLKGRQYWIEMYGKPIVCKNGGNQCWKDLERWASINGRS